MTRERRNVIEKKQEAVDSNKVALDNGGHNSKKVGSTISREKKILGLQEWIFTDFIENQQ